ncbi:MAG: ABC transporter substrate-binding protein [Deltaproteobacteria bacterium]|nr:ABC transporter substrate-binding protein [Deltaproteobacteria bacterium]
MKRLSRFVSGLAVIVCFMFSPTPGTPAENIVVAYSGVSGFQGPLWAFAELGLFPKYNLNPEIVLISGGTQSMQALLSGSIQFALASATPPISIRFQGGNVVIVAAALNKFPYSLVAQKEIDHPSKLTGKKIGIVNFGGSNELAVVLALKEWGIPRQSVTLLRSGDTAGRLIALSNRALDATLLSMPYTIEAKKLGFNVLAHMGDMQTSFPMTVVAVNRSFLEKKRPVVKQFLAGYSEAIYRLMQSKELGNRIYRKYLKQEDARILEATYEDIAGKFSFPPRINQEGLRNAAELAAKGGATARGDFNIHQFVDETVIDELEREGFFEGLRKK